MEPIDFQEPLTVWLHISFSSKYLLLCSQKQTWMFIKIRHPVYKFRTVVYNSDFNERFQRSRILKGSQTYSCECKYCKCPPFLNFRFKFKYKTLSTLQGMDIKDQPTDYKRLSSSN